MSAIVLELQEAAMDKETDVDDLLRRCVVIASKLRLKESLSWARKELDGYSGGDELPRYRIVPGEVKAFNPYNGLWLPFIWTDGPPEALRNRGVSQPVAELQDLLGGDKGGMLMMPLPEKGAYQLMQSSGAPRPPVFVISRSSLYGILDAVRNLILDWSLKLEADGILGEGMAFTSKEKQTAMSNTYNIENFSGIIGNVSSKHVQIGDYNSIHADLKSKGISQSERNELEHLMDEVPKVQGNDKKKLIAKGIAWVVRNADKLGDLSNAIRGWFENY
jgi:AbiTii